MTCVVGYVTADGTIYLGGDSAGVGVSGWDLTVREDPKVFRRGAFLIGFTTSFRMGQLLRYTLEVPDRHEHVDAHEYISTTFVDSVRKCLEFGGFIKKESNQESGGTFIVGYEGHLFVVYDDFQVQEAKDPYCAVGCGGAYAVGAMSILVHECLGIDPFEKVRLALSVAERNSAGVRAPFNIISS
jgi:ATP-dependent protease HslVU (ClpYQ) peptidase subunit